MVFKTFLDLGLYKGLIRGVGGAGADSPTSKMRTFFLMQLALSVLIFNKKYHRSQAVDFPKLWVVYDTKLGDADLEV